MTTLPLLGPVAAPAPPSAPSLAVPPEGRPRSPWDVLEAGPGAFLPPEAVARVMVLAGEYGAAMIEAHARRPGWRR